MVVRDHFFLLEYVNPAAANRKAEIITEDAFDILVNFGCSIQLKFADQTILLPGGRFLFLPGDSCFQLKAAGYLQYLHLQITSDLLKNKSLRMPSSVLSSAARFQGGDLIAEQELQYILDLTAKMIREYRAQSAAYTAFRYSWLSEILMNLFQNLPPESLKETETGVIPEITQFLELNYMKKISVDMLASRFYISKYHLMRQFKKETGYTIHNFILNKRVSHACNLIEKNVSPSEACYLSGFSDYSLFFKAFTKVTGSSPSRYQYTQYAPPGAPIETGV